MNHDQSAAPTRSVLVVAVATALWGTIGVVVAVLSRAGTVDPLVIGAARLLLAAPVLWIWHRVATGVWIVPIPKRLAVMCISAGLAFALYHVAYFSAIPRLGLTTAVLLNICTAPFFTLISARIWLGEHISQRRTWLIVGAVCGSVILVGGAAATAGFDYLGVALAVFAGLCYSVLVVLTRAVAPRLHPVLIQAIIMTVAGLWMVGVIDVGAYVVSWRTLPWLAFVYLAAVPTLVSYVLFTYGLRRVDATTAATLTLLEPLVSTLVAVMWLGERLSLWSWSGAGVLACCLLLLCTGDMPRSGAAAAGHDNRSLPG